MIVVVVLWYEVCCSMAEELLLIAALVCRVVVTERAGVSVLLVVVVHYSGTSFCAGVSALADRTSEYNTFVHTQLQHYAPRRSDLVYWR